MSNFRPINRDTGFLLPPSVDEWLPQRHLARFVVEVVDGLDLSELVKDYRGSGSASYHPSMLLGMLVYGYATKVLSSRALERATYDSVAFRFIAGNEHPDHDTIAAFRKRFIGQVEAVFIQVLQVARTMGMLKLGTVALDGTKVHANASRHSALSFAHAKKIEKQLKREVQQLLKLAENADAAEIPDGMSIPQELEHRESRLAAIAEAKAKLEVRAEERLERDQEDYQRRLKARAEEEKRRGRRFGGNPPEPPTGGVREQDQVNLTDQDSRIMKIAAGGFEQCYNAQAAVATGSLLVVATGVTQAANDVQQLVPMIEKIRALPKALGRTKRLLADCGYLSQANVEHCAQSRIEPLIAIGPSAHNLSWRQRFARAPRGLPSTATPMEKMAYQLKTPRGKKLYGLRKQTPEPVFGIIKSTMGYRQCLLRGLKNVTGEWSLVAMSWNIRRMFSLQAG